MRATLVRFGIVAAALSILSVAACTDQRDPVSPAKPNSVLLSGGSIIVLNPNDLLEIASGEEHTCVRKRSGAVSCWGANQYGQLGVTTTLCSDFIGDTGVPCSRSPVSVMTSGGFSSAKRLTAGSDHNCVIDGNNAAWCWGYNYFGQVGKGTGGNAPSPVLVAGGLTFAVLTAGENATCGSASAGGIFCWGQFPGSANSPGAYAPAIVTSGGGFTQIAVSSEHACGDIGSHNWLCWGSNKFGQLGVDPSTLPSSAPYTWLHQVDGATHLVIAANTTCAQQASGIEQCLGWNRLYQPNGFGSYSFFGLLGNPQFLDDATFQVQTVGALHGVALSSTHGCGLDATGAAFCWGLGAAGQLGNGTAQGSTALVPVAGGHLFSALSVGIDFSCGISTDNRVFCWGNNDLGQLGQPTAGVGFVTSPVQTAAP